MRVYPCCRTGPRHDDGRVRLEPRLALGEPLQPVVRNGLPGRGVRNIGAPARPYAWIAVEGPEAHAHLYRIAGVAAEQVRPALAAEALLKAAVRMAPALHQLGALQQPESAAVDPRLSRRRRSRTTLAAGAVAVTRGRRRLAELKPDPAAQTAACSRRVAHDNKVGTGEDGPSCRSRIARRTRIANAAALSPRCAEGRCASRCSLSSGLESGRLPLLRMDLSGHHSNPPAPLEALLDGASPGGDSRPEATGDARTCAPQTPGTAIVAAHPRLGRIIDAISQVLIDAGRPMQARDVHTRVEALLGEPIRWASVKATLAGNLAGPTPDSSGWHVDATASPLRAPEPERSSDGRDARFRRDRRPRAHLRRDSCSSSRLSHKPTGLVEMHSRPRTGMESDP